MRHKEEGVDVCILGQRWLMTSIRHEPDTKDAYGRCIGKVDVLADCHSKVLLDLAMMHVNRKVVRRLGTRWYLVCWFHPQRGY